MVTHHQLPLTKVGNMLTDHNIVFAFCTVNELLRFIKKESFSRGSDELPRKLTMQEARTMQLSNQVFKLNVSFFTIIVATVGKSLSADTRGSHAHDVVARESYDTRPSHGHF